MIACRAYNLQLLCACRHPSYCYDFSRSAVLNERVEAFVSATTTMSLFFRSILRDDIKKGPREKQKNTRASAAHPLSRKDAATFIRRVHPNSSRGRPWSVNYRERTRSFCNRTRVIYVEKIIIVLSLSLSLLSGSFLRHKVFVSSSRALGIARVARPAAPRIESSVSFNAKLPQSRG